MNLNMKRVFLVALVGLALTAAACTPQPGGATPSTTASTTVPATTPWTFTLHVGVTGDMVTRYGGMAALRTKIDNQLAEVNRRYATPFTQPIVWKISGDLFQYDAAPADVVLFDTGAANFTLLYTEDPVVDQGGYYSWVRGVVIRWPQAGYGGDFSSYGTDSVMHELGHARGALDIYCETIGTLNNPVNWQGYTAPSGVMSTIYGATSFDAYSKALINANGTGVYNDFHVADQSLPSTYQVKVQTSSGVAVNNASVNVYAGNCTGKAQSIQSTPQSTGTTTSGVWTMPTNPFTGGYSIQTKILLVTASAGGKSGFAWLPLHEAGLAFFAGQSTFTTTVTVG